MSAPTRSVAAAVVASRPLYELANAMFFWYAGAVKMLDKAEGRCASPWRQVVCCCHAEDEQAAGEGREGSRHAQDQGEHQHHTVFMKQLCLRSP